MDIPYGFDCFAFQREEIKYFESHLYGVKKSLTMAPRRAGGNSSASSPPLPSTTRDQTDYVKFTRKNEDYPREQLQALGRANRLNMSEIDKRIFCGIKIQIGIGVVTNFLRKGLQYKPPIRGRSELINGSWTGIMKGLTMDSEAPASYDLALGNFLAWDEEFPYIKFGPFFAVESKLVFLTGSSRRIETSSFGTNMTREIWITILAFLVALSLLAALQIHWEHTKRVFVRAREQVLGRRHTVGERGRFPATTTRASSPRGQECCSCSAPCSPGRTRSSAGARDRPHLLRLVENFFFIYFTMLLNKPSVEFDDMIWPRENSFAWQLMAEPSGRGLEKSCARCCCGRGGGKEFSLDWHASREGRAKRRQIKLPTSIRALSYMWSAACLVVASIYSGEMLAVMLLHTDQNIDTISQLINSKPRIEPVIRQDDFTYNLMLKSLDENMLQLHNMTKIIPRADVYTRQFIESVSERKVALLGDDELIETIYDLYHKYYPLYKSKVSYLQYPISIMYRKDLDQKLEGRLRRGMVQIFEMGLIHRWYQAQKDTYIQFYDTYERNKTNDDKSQEPASSANSEQKYKPLSIHHFISFYRAMFYCALFAFAVLLLEIVHARIGAHPRATRPRAGASICSTGKIAA